MSRKAIDIKGQRFGKLLALNYKGKSIWECRCDCGNIANVRYSDLRLNKTKSCGKCIEHKSNLIDLTGRTFGSWHVLEYVGNSYWKCRCSCGNIRNVKAYDLTHNKSTSCGCHPHEDLTGKTFGKWKVLKYVGDRKWLCRCSCGVEKEVYGKFLKSGQSKSCGHSALFDMIGETFGDLTVIEYAGHSKWRCRCSCGNYTVVESTNLLSGRTSSCGCKSKSTPKYTKEKIIELIHNFIDTNNNKPYIEDLQNLLDVSIGTIYKYIDTYDLHTYINHSSKSVYERDIAKIIDTDYILNNRSILNGKELDIYIPEKKIAIEFNGDYWHSELYKDKEAHQSKTIDCAKKGIHLIHIFEHEWNNYKTRDIITNYINSLVNNKYAYKIGARETYVKEISIDMCKEFIDSYHLQGYANSTINLGCFDKDNNLLGVMTFGKPRFNNTYQYELIRLCWLPSVLVSGGSEKLFKYFLRNYNPSSIISYCDISKFTGNSYLRLGFKVKSITEPGYIWYNPDLRSVLTRYMTRKHKLIENGIGNENMTEDSIMYSIGYIKIYNCGNLVLEYINKK